MWFTIDRLAKRTVRPLSSASRMPLVLTFALAIASAVPAPAQTWRDLLKAVTDPERNDTTATLHEGEGIEARRAAERGVAGAPNELSEPESQGRDAAASFSETARRFHLAARRNNIEAQFHLGNLYARGEGVPQDYGVAIHWYGRAAEQGHGEAQVRRERLIAELRDSVEVGYAGTEPRPVRPTPEAVVPAAPTQGAPPTPFAESPTTPPNRRGETELSTQLQRYDRQSADDRAHTLLDRLEAEVLRLRTAVDAIQKAAGEKNGKP